MTTMHLIPIAPAPPRTPGKVTTLTSSAAHCVLLPLQSTATAVTTVTTTSLTSEDEIRSSAKRLMSVCGGLDASTKDSNSNCKRKINFGGLSYTLPKPQSAAVVRRNERERNRVRKVNVGFAKLRDHVPGGKKNKKLSKVETLRAAVEYINQLQRMLDGGADCGADQSGLALETLASLSAATGGSMDRLERHGSGGSVSSIGSIGSLSSNSDCGVSTGAGSVCSPSSSIDTLGQSPEHVYNTDSPSPTTPSSAGPVSPGDSHSQTDFFDFTWLVPS